MPSVHATLWVLISFVMCTCREPEKRLPLMELLPSAKTGIDFANGLKEDEDLNIISFEYFYNGAGVGIGDINNDGLDDIFFAANMSSSKLYLNKGDMHFQDITELAGIKSLGKWASGVAMVDINQDRWMDIYVCYAGPTQDPVQRANELYINNGNNTFTERAKEFGLADTGHSVQAAFFDFDRDSDLDLYLLTNITDETGPNVIRHKRINGEMINTDRLYRNNGDHTFTDISRQAGVTIEGYGLGVSICDINRDGWSDIYASNDYLSNDLLYINKRDGTFANHLPAYFAHTSYSAMGNDVADYNNDGLVDVVTVDMLPPDNKRQKLMFGSTGYDRYRSELQYGYSPQFMRNTLQLNRGNDSAGQPIFSEIGQLAGVHATDWSWSPLFADIDNDGWKDLLISNGYPRDITNRDFASYKMQEFLQHRYDRSIKHKLLTALHSIEGTKLPVFAFKNNGDITFTDESSTWGFTTPGFSNGAAYADLDNDGDLDYVTNNIDGHAFIYKNHADTFLNHHYLRLQLEGPTGNMQGYGAKVLLYANNTVQYQEKNPYRGYLSSVAQDLHFGLGQANAIDSLIIEWPDGKVQRFTHIQADQKFIARYSDAWNLTPFKKNHVAETKLFTQTSAQSATFVHRETPYADFKIEPLLPHKYSENGPGIAVGDINGDGREDFFIGGAYLQSGKFFIQDKHGKFSTKDLTKQKKFEEDMGSLLFDADGDRDNDLYIVSGGNEFASDSPYYSDRLYINDGKGNFKLDPTALPPSTASGSCVVAADYDGDSDLDLFIGGRLNPHHYPQAGKSAILQNDKGHFRDVTKEIAPEIENIGLVTSALWTDIDNDQTIDLIVVGEWMPITILKNRKGIFKIENIPDLQSSTGWWNSIAGGDYDKDGDTDYIVGNIGLNSRYKTSPEAPVSLYVDDFNHDGMRDAILSHYIQGVNRPAHPRDDLFLQMAQFKKKYPSYKSYAEATTASLLDDTQTTPIVYQAKTFCTSYLENRGKAGWKMIPLPIESQFSPVFGIAIDDFDGDHHLDVLLSGNTDAPDVITGRYDASKGLMLKGDSKGNFQPLSMKASGVLIEGNGRALSRLMGNDGTNFLLAAQCDDSLKIFQNTITLKRKLITLRANDIGAIITDAAGNKSKQEFYYGEGYLSQSSRRLVVPSDTKAVTIFDSQGKTRTIR